MNKTWHRVAPSFFPARPPLVHCRCHIIMTTTLLIVLDKLRCVDINLLVFIDKQLGFHQLQASRIYIEPYTPADWVPDNTLPPPTRRSAAGFHTSARSTTLQLRSQKCIIIVQLLRAADEAAAAAAAAKVLIRGCVSAGVTTSSPSSTL